MPWTHDDTMALWIWGKHWKCAEGTRSNLPSVIHWKRAGGNSQRRKVENMTVPSCGEFWTATQAVGAGRSYVYSTKRQKRRFTYENRTVTMEPDVPHNHTAPIANRGEVFSAGELQLYHSPSFSPSPFPAHPFTGITFPENRNTVYEKTLNMCPSLS